MKDLIIVGGGPSGVAAAVYAARKRLTTTLIAEEIGGQSFVSEGIENWVGTPVVSGADLARNFSAHIEAVKDEIVELRLGERATKVERVEDGPKRGFKVETAKGASYTACAVLVATGACRRKLDIPGAAAFENKGVTYCASCDGPLFADKDVAVIGGGNAGFETALQLLAYCKSVTLIHRHKEFKADPVTVEKVSANPKMRVLSHAEPLEVLGDQFVTGFTYKNKDTGEVTRLAVEGIFVEAGVIPNTGLVENLLTLDTVKRVVVDPKNQHTNVEGVWAAGDCTDELYHQNNIAAGDGVKALEDIYLWLKTR